MPISIEADPSLAQGYIKVNGTTAATVTSTGLTTASLQNAAVTNDKLSLAANAGEIKKALNADNSPPIYACRAWVTFNGGRNEADTGASTNGANVRIRASGNVASVLKNATGDYTITFSTAMPDANYSASVTAGRVVAGGVGTARFPDSTDPFTTTTARVEVTRFDGVGLVDAAFVSVQIFR
jgi:hypothetical protein